MLGKLIKYDLKLQMKLLGAAYLVVMLVSGVSAIAELAYRNFADSNGILGMVNLLTRGLAILAIIVMVAGTLIYAVLYFRKNLFKDQGYLMHTLPVKAWQLYMSKWISGSLCSFLSILVAMAALALTYVRIPDIGHFLSDMIDAGVPGWFLPITVFVVLLSVPANLTQFYVSLAFGYTIQPNTTSPVNKDLLSVISYIVLYMIQQVVGVVVIVIWIALNAGSLTGDSFLEAAEMDLASAAALEETFRIVAGTYVLSLVILLVLSAVLSALSIWRMEKHLNLN